MERPATLGFAYTLVSEEGEHVGDVVHEEEPREIGDLVGCGGHTYEVIRADGEVLSVRRVIYSARIHARCVNQQPRSSSR